MPPKTPFSAPASIRYVGPLSGRYTLTDATGTKAFACRTASLSPTSITLAAPESGGIGQSVAILLEQVGLVRAIISRRVPGGFQADITGSEADRDKLAARINWLKSHRLRGVADMREAPRRIPRNPSARFYLADGSEHPCFLIDVSLTGAGISARTRPEVGTSIKIGSLPATVVRHMDTGFGIAFREVADLDAVEAGLRWRRGSESNS